jgi:DNA-binding SARP family transcriptional activator
LRFSLLGPLAVADGAGARVAVAGPRLRVLLAALLLHANMPVPADALAEMVWDGSPPPEAVSTLRSYVRRLRRLVDPEADRIMASDHGYVLRAGQAELDVLEFEGLCRDTRAALRAGEWADASAGAARALGLWRAAPLLDVPGEILRGEFVPRLERLRLQVLEDRFDAGLLLGQHRELVPGLLDVTARYPLHERFHGQLMLALAGTGRRAEALGAYQRARGALVDELGVEPGRELRGIHLQVLAGDADGSDGAAPGVDEGLVTAGAPAGVAGVPADAAGPSAVRGSPAQLPADIPDFTGRGTQVAYLHGKLAVAGTAGPGTVQVVVIAGAAGLGKTALAVHVAHQVRGLFAGGQLYTCLSGASARPAAPGEVLARFLRDLGVDGGQIPAGEEERAVLYRTRLAGRQVLIVLDDASDAAQVRPLLPGSASCAVLVTTRNTTPNLLGTGLTDLGTLPDSEALELFSAIAGDARPAAEPQAVAEVLAACAGLPLAIRICAARLAARPRWPIAAMAARLRDERRRLDELQIGDLEVRASFQVSYGSLRAGRHRVDPARVFRLLGTWDGQRIRLPAAAALTGEREEDLAGVLEALVDVNLLESPEPDWYQLHDLLHLFAAERAQAEESGQARLEAVTRLLQWYLATATAASDLLSPYRYRSPDDDPPPPGPLPGSAQDALAWYDREHVNLIAAIRQAQASGLHDLAWRLPIALFEMSGRRHNWADCVTTHRIAVDSARITGSRLGEAWALHNLGWGLAMLGDAAAFGYLEKSSAIRQELGDLDGQAQATIALAETHLRIHGVQTAYDYSLRTLQLLRETEDYPATLAAGLNNHGANCMFLGKYDEATKCLQEALAILTTLQASHGLGHVLMNLGCIHLQSGRFTEAITTMSEAHRLLLAQGHLLGQAQALRYLGQAQRGAGQPDQARKSLEAALSLFQSLQAPAEAEAVRSALAALA